MQAKKRALETVSSSRDERYQQTVVSSADGAKVLNNLDKLVSDYEENGERLSQDKKEHLKPRPLPQKKHINQQSFQVLSVQRY